MSNLEKLIDETYDCFDRLFTHGQFEEADSIIAKYDVNLMDETLLIAVLVSTLPARHSLPNRKIFFDRVRRKFLQDTSPEYVEACLRGLD